MRLAVVLCGSVLVWMKGICAFSTASVQVVRLASAKQSSRPLFVSFSSSSNNTTSDDAADGVITRVASVEEEDKPSNPTDTALPQWALQTGLAVVALILVVTITSSVLTAVTGAASSAAGALGDEMVREVGHVGELLITLLGALLTATWNVLTVALPALFKGLVSLGQAAAPVVQAVGEAVGEAASPIVDETTARIAEAAAPYVDRMSAAVDAQIVQPTLGALDANVVAPLKDVGNSVTSAVDSTLQQATDTVTNSINDKINELNMMY
jgi:hypothetical protein